MDFLAKLLQMKPSKSGGGTNCAGAVTTPAERRPSPPPPPAGVTNPKADYEARVQFVREFVVELVENIPQKSEKAAALALLADKEDCTSVSLSENSYQSVCTVDSALLPDLLQPEAVYKKHSDTDTDTADYESAADTGSLEAPSPIGSLLAEEIVESFQERLLSSPLDNSPLDNSPLDKLGNHTLTNTSLKLNQSSTNEDCVTPKLSGDLKLPIASDVISSHLSRNSALDCTTDSTASSDDYVDVEDPSSISELGHHDKTLGIEDLCKGVAGLLLNTPKRLSPQVGTDAKAPSVAVETAYNLPEDVSAPLQVGIFAVSSSLENQIVAGKTLQLLAGLTNTEAPNASPETVLAVGHFPEIVSPAAKLEKHIVEVLSPLSLGNVPEEGIKSEVLATLVETAPSAEFAIDSSPLDVQIIETFSCSRLDNVSEDNKTLFSSTVQEPLDTDTETSPVKVDLSLVSLSLENQVEVAVFEVDAESSLENSVPVDTLAIAVTPRPVLDISSVCSTLDQLQIVPKGTKTEETEESVEESVETRPVVLPSTFIEPSSVPCEKTTFEVVGLTQCSVLPIVEIFGTDQNIQTRLSTSVANLEKATLPRFEVFDQKIKAVESTTVTNLEEAASPSFEVLEFESVANLEEIDLPSFEVLGSVTDLEEAVLPSFEVIESESVTIPEEAVLPSFKVLGSGNLEEAASPSFEILESESIANFEAELSTSKYVDQNIKTVGLQSVIVTDLEEVALSSCDVLNESPSLNTNPFKEESNLSLGSLHNSFALAERDPQLLALSKLCWKQQRALEADGEDFVDANEFVANKTFLNNSEAHATYLETSGLKEAFIADAPLTHLTVAVAAEQTTQDEGDASLEELLAAEAERVSVEIINASLELNESDTGDMADSRTENSDKVNPFVTQSVLRRSPPSARKLSPRRSASPAKRLGIEGSRGDSPKPRLSPARNSPTKKTTHTTDPENAEVLSKTLTINPEVNQSEAGPEIADEAQFQSSGDVFKDPSAFDFLSSVGNSQTAHDLRKQSLYVKFDPLVGQLITTDKDLPLPPHFQENSVTPPRDEHGPPLNNSTPVKNPALAFVDKLISLSPSPQRDIYVKQEVQSPAYVYIDSPAKIINHSPPRVSKESPAKILNVSPIVQKRLQESGSKTSPVSNGNTANPTAMLEELYLLRELLSEQDVTHNAINAQNTVEIAKLKAIVVGLQARLAAGEDRETKLKKHMVDNTQAQQQMTVIMEEYEKTISGLVAAKEQQRQDHDLKMATLVKESEESAGHLTNMEIAFSDVHKKYERSKEIIDGLKQNEDVLRATLERYKDSIQKEEQKYESLKVHAITQLENANQELDAVKRSQQAEAAKLNAMLKKSEIGISSLMESLDQKVKENKELAAICDELISKVGTSN